MEVEKEDAFVNKLAKRTKKIQIDDEDVGEWEALFKEHFHPQSVSRFCKSSGSKRNPVCLFSDVFCDETKMLCGLDIGICKPVDLNQVLEDRLVVDHKNDWGHTDLSCVRCSRASPEIFFSSSLAEGTIYQWDLRQDAKTPCQTFSTAGAGNPNNAKVKPILQFDVSCNDQLLCAGTEMVDEDSFLLFWDVRSTKILGAYWESHSDDITAVKFHSDQVHSLASGSTDGLLNVFNLLETEEDDALLYSFNTNSSVERVHWFCPPGKDAQIACVTHTNDIQVWNTNTGDPVIQIDRKLMAKTMLRSNPEAVYVTGCYNVKLQNITNVNVIANSLSGSGNTRLIQLNQEMKPEPLGIFRDQTSVVQTAQYIPTTCQWLTFDELGIVKVWKSSTFETKEEAKIKSKEVNPIPVEKLSIYDLKFQVTNNIARK